MGNMTHAAGRAALGKALDLTMRNLNKDPEGEIVKLIDWMEKYMSGEKLDVDFDKAKEMVCNLHCTGRWAAEYGNRLNLTFEEMDNVITQGKELGIYFYMYTGGEPLVRKADIIRLCKKHHDCAFLAYTNGTLVDEAFCKEMKRVGNLYLAISLEGFAEVNDLRRGEGVYGKVMKAMDLLKENGLIFGTSICYTSKNIETVTSDEFIDLIVKKGCRYALYFHYMSVGNDAAVELLPTMDQRLYMHDRVREIRNMTHVRHRSMPLKMYKYLFMVPKSEYRFCYVYPNLSGIRRSSRLNGIRCLFHLW